MSIDPARHQAQLRAVANLGERPVEYKCPTCGTRTRNRAGKCRACLAAGLTADLSFLTIEQLLTMAANARAELRKRADLAAQAVRECP